MNKEINLSETNSENLMSETKTLIEEGYTITIINGIIMVMMPERMLYESSEEERTKLSELAAELNIRCQELGVDFKEGFNFDQRPERKKVAIVGGGGRPVSLAGALIGSASEGYFLSPSYGFNYKGNPTDNETWQPTRIRKGYGHNKLKGKKAK